MLSSSQGVILKVGGGCRGGFGHGGKFSGQCGFFGSHGVVVDIMEVGMTVMDLVIVETVSEVVEASDILVARAITINFLI